MYCNRCKQDREEGSRFCCGCGKPLPAPLAASSVKMIPQRAGTIPCASCHAKSQETSRFCWSCGAALYAAEATVAVPTLDPMQVREMLGKAHELQEAGKPLEAIGILCEVVEAEPRSVLAREFLGDLYLQNHQGPEAAREYAAALEVIPDSLELRRKHALACGRRIADPAPRMQVSTRDPDEALSGARPFTVRIPWLQNPAVLVICVLLAMGIFSVLGRFGLVGMLVDWVVIYPLILYFALQQVEDIESPLWAIFSFVVAGIMGLIVYLMVRNSRRAYSRSQIPTRFS